MFGVTLVALVTLTTCVAPSVASAQSSPPTFSWPEMHENPQLTGYSPDPAISTANAGSLGVSWMTYTGAPVLASPVVAWNAETSKTLIYVGNEAGVLTAYDQATGLPVWSESFPYEILSTPLVEGGSIWVSPNGSYRIYKVDAGTGAVQCSTAFAYKTMASPTIATPPGGRPTIYMATTDSPTFNGPVYGIDEATCAIDFSVTPEPRPATGGVWDSLSYGVSATGEGLVLFGTSDPDESVYALDAITGATVWRYQGVGTGDDDYGAGITISLPGVNGIADGAAYGIDKDGYITALDLTTGAVYWSEKAGQTIATPALDGNELVVGVGSLVGALNAVNGKVLWLKSVPAGTDASPLVVGPSGSEVVAFGDLGGMVRVLSLATGTTMFTYPTGNYITSGMAEVSGNLIETSADGFLYDFAPGGGTGAAPTTAVTSPVNSSTVANPNGTLNLSGTAGASGGPAVGGVTVAIQSGGSAGQWWDSATGTWVTSPYPNPAILASPGSATSTWTFGLPVPAAGGTYEAFASAVGTNGQADRSAFLSTPSTGRSTFTVSAGTGPTISIGGQYWVTPATPVSASGSGFAPGETVNVSLDGTVITSTTASSTGTFGPTQVKIPVGTSQYASFGPANLTATGTTSGSTAIVAIYLSNSWTEAGGGPLHQSSEPNDNVLNQQIGITSGSLLNQAWQYSSGAPIASSPVIYHGVAYFADTGGGVTAVNIASGTTRWHTVVAAGSGIDASPALAAVGAGILVVGTEAGSVVALNAANGASMWSTSLGSSAIESAPSIANGSPPTVYVGNDAGQLSALSATNGAVLWQTTLGGAVQSSPALDAASSLLVVGDTSGHVTAVTASTGVTKWSFAAGGPVVASAVIYQNGVYIGSESGTFYDLNEQTGAQVWATPTAGAITASAAVLWSQVYVGDGNGNIYGFSYTTGASSVVGTLPNAVVGLVATTGFLLAQSAGGLLWQANVTMGLYGLTMSLGGTAASGPVIVNGTVYAAASNGLHCFTIPGAPPV